MIGSIVTKPLNDAVNAMGLWQDENQVGDFVKGMLDVLATPPNYLDPDKLFLLSVMSVAESFLLTRIGSS